MGIETRACRPEEFPALMVLVNRVFRSGGGGDMEAEYPLVFCRGNLENLRVVPGRAGPVAHVGVCLREACLLGARLRVASIGAVGTDPDQRGQGLASALMEDARRHAREAGAALMLISGGRGLYHRLGYVNVGSFFRYHWTAADLHGVAVPGVELTGLREADLTEIAALYQAEPVRFIRPMADWERLIAAGMLMNQAADLVPIRQDGHLVAYAGVQHTARQARGEDRTLRIQEYAGSRRAVIAALPALLAHYSAVAVSLSAQCSDMELAVQARLHGWTPTRQTFPGTVGVLDPEALFEALRPVLVERAAAAGDLRIRTEGERAILALGSELYEVGALGQLAALLFGGDTEEARAIPPRHGALGELLDTLFPLPLLWYGYNYV